SAFPSAHNSGSGRLEEKMCGPTYGVRHGATAGATGHRRHGTRLALALLACFAPSMAAAQEDCFSAPPIVERPFLLQSRYVGYYGSHDLAAYDASVKRAVIMIHGLEREAASY